MESVTEILLMAQAETVMLEKLAGELAKQQTAGNGQVVYIFVLAIAVMGCGFFYALRYLMGHTREIHEKSHENIKTVTQDHKEACHELTKTFNSEMMASREQHHKDVSACRDMVHVARDLAQSAVSSKEYAAALEKERGVRVQP